MKNVISLSIGELRSFLVRYHYLDNYGRLSGKAGIKKLLRRIGSVQYDPLNVAGRNSDLVFQSRVQGYSSDILEDLLYSKRELVDGWDKEMSIYSTVDWPNFARIRKLRGESARDVLRRRGQEEVLAFLPQIIEEIKNRGPLSARDLKLGATQKSRWGHRQVSGAALDYLNLSGVLGVYKKNSAQKIYDLIGNLLPEKILNTSEPFTAEDAFYEWYFLRRIGSIGAYWRRNGPGWLGYFLTDASLRQKIFDTLEEKKLIVPIKVPELAAETRRTEGSLGRFSPPGINEFFYLRRKDLPLLNKKDGYDNIARILAPLDNMIWDRLMVQKVFGFQYTWEVYAPENKRKYGYYVLPVLYQNNLIARLEPVRYEKGKPFVIKNWWWEEVYEKSSAKEKRETKEAVLKGLENFAAYLGADGVDRKNISI